MTCAEPREERGHGTFGEMGLSQTPKGEGRRGENDEHFDYLGDRHAEERLH